jgi:hypothetical protein
MVRVVFVRECLRPCVRTQRQHCVSYVTHALRSLAVDNDNRRQRQLRYEQTLKFLSDRNLMIDCECVRVCVRVCA